MTAEQAIDRIRERRQGSLSDEYADWLRSEDEPDARRARSPRRQIEVWLDHDLGGQTLSCAHPEAPRYAKRQQGNCGYCFPCLIRRAALHHVGLDDADDYAFDALNEPDEMAKKRGADLRALVRSLNRDARPIDVLRNGPVQPDDVHVFADVFGRGRVEILAWLRAATTTRTLRRQLPR